MNNLLFIDKPKGISSFDVCYKLRKVLNTKKIGHTGTLDNNATGVMIILFNKATKANQFIVSKKKTYIARVLLGIKTDTLDIDGNVIEEKSYEVPNKELLISTLNSFLGKSKQEVPITSAVSVNGKRLYQYQRENKEVILPIRDIEVYSIKLLEMYNDGFSFECEVSKGTYIRALVKDILDKLNLIGTTLDLRRIAIDGVTIDKCDKLEDVLNNNYSLHELIDVIDYKQIELTNIDDIIYGKRIKLDCDEQRVLITKDSKAIAVYEKDGDLYKSVRGLW